MARKVESAAGLDDAGTDQCQETHLCEIGLMLLERRALATLEQRQCRLALVEASSSGDTDRRPSSDSTWHVSLRADDAPQFEFSSHRRTNVYGAEWTSLRQGGRKGRWQPWSYATPCASEELSKDGKHKLEKQRHQHGGQDHDGEIAHDLQQPPELWSSSSPRRSWFSQIADLNADARMQRRRLSACRRVCCSQQSLFGFLFVALIFLSGWGDGSWRHGLSGVGAKSYSPTCPTDIKGGLSQYYRVERTFINASDAKFSHTSFNPSSQITREQLEHLNVNFNMRPTVVACEVSFPSTPQDMMLWHFGSGGAQSETKYGAWLGLRTRSGVSRLRLRAGGAGANISADGNHSVAHVDIDYGNLMDNQTHQVVAWIGGSLQQKDIRVALWIDGIYRGSGSSGDGQYESNQWTDKEDASYGLLAQTSIPLGENNTDWVGHDARILSTMEVMQPATPDSCGSSTGGTVLFGDWTSTEKDSLGYWCCEKCPANSMANVTEDDGSSGVNICRCLPGHTGQDGEACTTCPPGTQKPEVGSSPCTSCAAGSYILPSDSTGGETCHLCAAGKFSAGLNATTCIACPEGTYANSTGSSTCVECPGNTTTFGQGAPNVSQCECIEGYEGNVSGAPCSRCLSGTAKNWWGIGTCRTCGTTDYYLTTTSKDGRTCICASGAHRDEAGMCAQCQSGKFKSAPGDQACDLCIPGKYQPYKGQIECRSCRMGTFNTRFGRHGSECFSCKGCPPNTNSPLASAKRTACIANAGYSGRDGSEATPCEAGTYKPVNGSSPCLTCKAKISMSLKGSTMCKCNLGYYSPFPDIDGANCLPCNAGFVASTTGSLECSLCPAGKYTSNNGTGSTGCVSCTSNSFSQLSFVGYQAVANTSMSFVSSWISLYDASIGYTVVINASTNNSHTTNCSASNCSCSGSGVPLTSSPWNLSCGCRCEPASHEICSAAYCNCTANGTSVEIGKQACGCSCVKLLESARFASDCKCNAGYTSSGTGSCVACAKGKYKTKSGQEECRLCEAGTYQDQLGQTSCLDCPSSSISINDGSENISMCLCEGGHESGTHRLSITEMRCRLVPWNNQTNNSNITDAKATAVSSTPSPNNGDPPQTTPIPTNVSVVLVPEYYNYTFYQNVSMCLSCQAGKYRTGYGNEANGNGECLPCQNHSNSIPGSEYCTCDDGFVQIDRLSPCYRCTQKEDKGLHQLDHLGVVTTNSENECDAGFYWRECTKSADSGCIPCPPNSHSTLGSEGYQSCLCNKGYTGPDGGPCIHCPQNTFKNVTGKSSCTVCPGLPGLLVSPNASISVVNCTCPLGYEARLGPNASAADQQDPKKYTADCMCTPGYYWDVSTETCKNCQPGTWNNVTASTRCDDCEIGKFTDKGASTVCTLCTPVTRCPIGQYWKTCLDKGAPVDGHCVGCSRKSHMPANAGFSGPGRPLNSDACPFTCNSGYESVESEDPSACSPCPLGTFRGKTDWICTLCPYPTTAESNASAYCLDCEQGFCFNGFRTDGHADCIECPSPRTSTQPDAFTRGFTDNCRCEPGYFGYSWACEPCKPGTYKSSITELSDYALHMASVDTGFTTLSTLNTVDVCTACPEGSFNNIWASTTIDSCVQCNTHSSTHGDTSRCICNAGYYDEDRSDQAQCSACPRDTYNQNRGMESRFHITKSVTNETVCAFCMDNSWSPTASTSIKACRCNAGFSLHIENTGERECKPCPENSYSTLHDDSCIQCPNGTITTAGLRDSLDVCVCPANRYGILNLSNWDYRPNQFDWQLKENATHHCKACPNNSATGAGSTVISSCQCLLGKAGDPANGGECQSCPGNTSARSDRRYCMCNAGYYDNFSLGNESLFIEATDPNPQQCTACPDNSVSPFASIFVEKCTCNSGYYGRPTLGILNPCQLCPGNSTSDASLGAPVDITHCTCNIGFSGDPGASPRIECQSCIDLDPNSYTYSSTDAYMCTCNAGYYGELYSETQQPTCFACPVNSYNNLTSQKLSSACIACPQYSETNSTGKVHLSDCMCVPGFYHSGTKGEKCMPCPSNSYQDERGQYSCKTCTDNAMAPPISTDITDCLCQAGYFRVGGSDGQCIACSSTSFKLFVGDEECEACPPYSSASEDRTTCLCNQGYYGGPDPQFGGECRACPLNTYQPEFGKHEASDCISCTQNASSPVASSYCTCDENMIAGDLRLDLTCIACPPNSVSSRNSTNIFDCLCREGFYYGLPEPTPTVNAGPNATAPIQNTPAPQEKSCWPAACPLNAVTRPGANRSSDCHCEEGHFGNPEGDPVVPCVPCPANASAQAGTLSISGCRCNANFYGTPESGAACSKCPDGAASPEGSRTIEDCRCLPGFFGKPTAPSGSPGVISNASAGNDNRTSNDTSEVSWSLLDSIEFYCKDTYYASHASPLDSPYAVEIEWSPEESFEVIADDVVDAWNLHPAIIVSRAKFPVTAQDGLLWHFGGSDYGASLGVRNATDQMSKVLRLRAGRGNDIAESAADIAFLDIEDFPTDGKIHQVVAYVECSVTTSSHLKVVLYIDGKFKGQATSNYSDGCTNGWTDSDGNYSDYVQGEPHDAWPGNSSAIGDKFYLLSNATLPQCANAPASHWLDLTWSANALSDLTVYCCVSCPPHQVSNGTSRTSVSSCVCSPGYTDINGVCTACAIGKYKESRGTGPCEDCVYGRFAPTPGTASCSNPICKACPANAISLNGSADLTDCQCKAGFYGNARLGLACIACPSSSSSLQNAVSVANCTCDSGFYGSPGHGVECLACPANSAPLIPSPRFIQNCSCNAGYFGSPTRYSVPACLACPVDTYNMHPGLPAHSNCTLCPRNSTSANSTAGRSRGSCQCDKGFYGRLESPDAMCLPCPSNTYGPTRGAPTRNWCRLCPANSAVRSGGVGTSLYDCECDAGYWREFNSTNPTCTACPNLNCSLQLLT